MALAWEPGARYNYSHLVFHVSYNMLYENYCMYMPCDVVVYNGSELPVPWLVLLLLNTCAALKNYFNYVVYEFLYLWVEEASFVWDLSRLLCGAGLCGWFTWGLIVPGLVRHYVVLVLGLGRFARTVGWLLWVIIGRNTTLGWLLECVAAWVVREKAPPPVLEVEGYNTLDVIGGPQESRLARLHGWAFSQGENLPHASVVAGEEYLSRRRKRARWVNALQDYLGGRPGIVGRLIRRRWEPDLPSDRRSRETNALLGILDVDVKLCGGGAIPTKGDARNGIFVVLETPYGRQVVLLSLFGRLSRFAALRCRDSSLWGGLRSRALEWCKSKGISPVDSALLIPAAVSLAFLTTRSEKIAASLLENHGYNATELSQGK